MKRVCPNDTTHPVPSNAQFCIYCQAFDPTVISPGETVTAVSDQYTVKSVLVAGRLATSYLALSQSKVKVILKERASFHGSSNAELRKMFIREAEILRKLEHSSYLKCLGQFEFEGRDYIVTEYPEGKKLERTGLSNEQILEYGVQCCEALKYLHDQGFLHRNLKPEKIWIRPNGTIVILGLDVACQKGEKTMKVGTFQFEPPEQAFSQPVLASDVYGLAATLYTVKSTRELPDPYEERLQAVHDRLPKSWRQVFAKALDNVQF